ncbi:mitochondrial ribosomal protein L44 [Venturia nashicola]|uniref:Large ribosomal subunit protein mL53 n=1 Tax=Venturia nashicola TaxID=86259 RepID=A0A4Z1NNQ1_9PEZI|nr:mitochondrial ribosomal protein L44 [Venturia nashicola]TLD24430.1 mitochondrial ribosomal protein L44 [Venturia nashicola]
MIPRFLTDVTVKFNPFSPKSKAARIFLSLLPPDARQTMKISVAQLPRASEEKATLAIKFKDGKEMSFDPEIVKIKKVVEEVDRHSRLLARQEELTSS